MNENSRSLLNGVSTQYINIHDRAIHYGDGLFETILSKDGDLYYWAQHYQRLALSAAKLQINCPPEELLLADIRKLLSQNDNRYKAVKIIVTRGIGKRGYVFPSGENSNRLVTASVMDKNYSSLFTGQVDNGALYICQHQVSINESLAGIKHLNRLENVLARNEFNQSPKENYIDGLMLDARQHVIEATMSNIFAVKDSELITPDISQSGVKGVMREIIIRAAEEFDLKVSVKDIKLDELLQMDEIFISNSLIGLKSVSKLQDTTFDNADVCKLLFDKIYKQIKENVQNN